jgi:hypothetical protein
VAVGKSWLRVNDERAARVAGVLPTERSVDIRDQSGSSTGGEQACDAVAFRTGEVSSHIVSAHSSRRDQMLCQHSELSAIEVVCTSHLDYCVFDAI